MAKKVEALVGQPKETRDLNALTACLRNISVVTRSTLLSLNYEFREDREEEDQKSVKERENRLNAALPDRPSYIDVLQAREALGLETANPVLLPAAQEREEHYQMLPVQQARITSDDRDW